MEKRKLILCRGIQASGKSTWAKAWAKEDPEHRVRFNNDDIRNMLGEYWVPNREGLVTELKRSFACEATRRGYNIVIDNMNLNPKEVKWWEDVIKVANATWRRYRDFIIQEDIKNMLSKSAEHVDGGHPVILVDMDATLCLNTTGRPYYGDGAAEGMLNDIAIEGTCTLVRRMYEKCKVFIVTGREGTPEIVAATKEWLAKHDIKVDELFFRPVKDYSPGAECKKKIYEDNIKGKYNVQFVLEDNCKCVEMWREQGLTCLQPNEGKF